MNPDHMEIAKRWFKHHSGSLLLPDGWFGRPYDNQHTLSTMQMKDDLFEVLLDDGKGVLSFYGLGSIWVEGKDLVFGRFNRAEFRYLATEGIRGGIVRTYLSGEVRFVCGP